MGFDFDDRYECRQYTSEYLYRDESVIQHASRLFSAGEAETVFPVDVMDGASIWTAVRIVIWPLLNLFGKETDIGDRNPHVPYYKSPSDDRNKLMVFQKWLVRCTYQQYNAKLDKELFYFIGAPLEHIESVSIINNNALEIYAGRPFGGGMNIFSKDKENYIQLFNDLKSQNRLHPEIMIYQKN